MKLDELIDARLTAAEYRLYLYLTKLDRGGNRTILLEPKEIVEHLGINRDTFFVGVSKLKELGLYDYKARMGIKIVENTKQTTKLIPLASVFFLSDIPTKKGVVGYFRC